jgi:hypothetical protein
MGILSKYRVGQAVRLQYIQGEPELNGQTGVLDGWRWDRQWGMPAGNITLDDGRKCSALKFQFEFVEKEQI